MLFFFYITLFFTLWTLYFSIEKTTAITLESNSPWIVFIDASSSMQTKDVDGLERFSLAKETTLNLIEKSSAPIAVFLFSESVEPYIPLTEEKVWSSAMLKKLPLSKGESRFNPLKEFIDTHFQNLPSHILIFSDGEPFPQESLEPLKTSSNIFYLALTGSREGGIVPNNSQHLSKADPYHLELFKGDNRGYLLEMTSNPEKNARTLQTLIRHEEAPLLHKNPFLFSYTFYLLVGISLLSCCGLFFTLVYRQ